MTAEGAVMLVKKVTYLTYFEEFGHLNSSCRKKSIILMFLSSSRDNSPFVAKLSDTSFFSQILDFFYWTVLIYISIYFEWRDTKNQHSLQKAYFFCLPLLQVNIQLFHSPKFKPLKSPLSWRKFRLRKKRLRRPPLGNCLGKQALFMWRHSDRLKIGRKEKKPPTDLASFTRSANSILKRLFISISSILSFGVWSMFGSK